jgi:hypothetical protein
MKYRLKELEGLHKIMVLHIKSDQLLGGVTLLLLLYKLLKDTRKIVLSSSE